MNYRSIEQMNQLIRSRISIVPNDVDIIIGVPRSGMLPASIIALLLNKPLISINELTCPTISSFSTRNIKLLSEYKKALIIDDSCNTGYSIERAKKFIGEHLSGSIEALYGCIYATDESTKFVDLFFEVCNQPRAFEWNIMNHWVITQSCLDLDGVLCVDPTEEQNDDGPRYLDFIENAIPLFAPKYQIGAIVTSRLEKYRKETESWLHKNNIEYKELVMLDVPDKATRMRLGLHGIFKAKIYQNCDAALFVESADSQARYINLFTNKPVYCTGSNKFYNRDDSFDKYVRIKRLGKQAEEKAYTALSFMYDFHEKAQSIVEASTAEGAAGLFEDYFNNLSVIFDEVCLFCGESGNLKNWIDKYIDEGKKRIKKDVNELPEYFTGIDLTEPEFLIDTSIHEVILAAASRVSMQAWNEEHSRVVKELTAEIIENDPSIEGYDEEIGYLKKLGKLALYPYSFTEKYDETKVIVNCDSDRHLKYVDHNGRKLYFPPKEDDIIRSEYNQLIMEQDIESPHHYFSDMCDFSEGDIFVDVGAAEGIISLDVVERAKEVYLLECSEDWIQALEATFADYSHKVHIIKKYAGRLDDENTITIDTLLKEYSGENIFIKIDAEGMELDILKSSVNTLLNNNCKLSCATYHTKEQWGELAAFFDYIAYDHDFSERYMLFYYGKMVLQNGFYEHIEKPYFRHALIRAWRL